MQTHHKLHNLLFSSDNVESLCACMNNLIKPSKISWAIPRKYAVLMQPFYRRKIEQQVNKLRAKKR